MTSQAMMLKSAEFQQNAKMRVNYYLEDLLLICSI